MPIHDCETCEARGDCALEKIASWINEHRDELTQAVQSQASELASACSDLAMVCPTVMRHKEAIKMLATTCFMLGYHKGKTYQDVPEAFKEV